MISSRLSRFTRKGTRKILRLKPVNRETKGLPEEISFDMLNRLCVSCLDDPLESVTYSHLSGWKSSNTYRLKLECEHGSKWNLIYKNASYGDTVIPALVEFPFNPGRAEYAIYSSPVIMMMQYLPEVYICSEIEAGIRYLYLIEDLSQNYRQANKRTDVFNATKVLTDIYRKSDEILRKIDYELLPRYDSKFSSELKKYVIKYLELYTRVHTNNNVKEICKLWNRISGIYDKKNDYTRLFSFLHGDPNVSNIMVNKKNESQIKFIDWEWAGIGLPHQDLASLLKRSVPSIELESLKTFSKSNNSLSFREHIELYEICQIERGLIDASFLAAQKINTSNTTKVDIDGYIDDSAMRVLRAYDRLT